MSVSRTGLSVAGPVFLRFPGRLSTYCLTSRLTYLRRSSFRVDVPGTSGPGCRSLKGVEGPCALGATYGRSAARDASAACGASAALLSRVISYRRRTSSTLRAVDRRGGICATWAYVGGAICGCMPMVCRCAFAPTCRGLGNMDAACCPLKLCRCSSSCAGGRILAICCSNSATRLSASRLACLSVDSSSVMALWHRAGAALCCRCSCATRFCKSAPARRICSLDRGISPASGSSPLCACAKLSGMKS